MLVTRRAEDAGTARTTGPGSAVAVLLALIDEGFDRRSWHGTNLRGMTPARALWRPGRTRHNIWEFVTHAACWKYTVRRRLTGEKRGSFALPGSNFFPAPRTATQTDGRDNVALLTREHRRLRDAAERLEDRDLARPVGRGQDTIGGWFGASPPTTCITRVRSS